MFETILTEVFKLSPRQIWGVEQLFAMISELITSFSLKKLAASLLAMLEMAGLIILDSPTTPRGEELDLTGYSLVFEDESEGAALKPMSGNTAAAVLAEAVLMPKVRSEWKTAI